MSIDKPFSHRLAFVADTSAMFVFFTTTGIINERFVAGMSWEQIFYARLLGAALMLPCARAYGIWRDWIMRRAGSTWLSHILWDSLAMVSFQVPIYAAILAVNGASGGALVIAALSFAASMLVLGGPYGAFLNWVRRQWGLPPAIRPAIPPSHRPESSL